MKIVFVTIELPSIKKGAPVRVYNLIKQAVGHGFVVDVASISDASSNEIERLKADLGVNQLVTIPSYHMGFLGKVWQAVVCRKIPYLAEYRRSRLSEALLNHVSEHHPDIIQFEVLHAYYATESIQDELKKMGCKILLDAHNVEYKAFKESVGVFTWTKRLLGEYIAPKLKEVEIRAVKNVDHLFTCSEIDKKCFKEIIESDKISVLPNGVDCNRFSQSSLVNEPEIIFIGSTYYPPNEDALRYFFSKCYPLIKSKIPKAKITLLGDEPVEWLRKLSENDKSISTPGLVPDVREYIKKSRVCISPIRKGSGTSLKLLEYMGSGKPIVSTSVGARGIDCRDNDNMLIADDAEKFAESVIKLLTDDELANRLGLNARAKACKMYNWENISVKMTNIYQKLILK